MRQLIKHPLLYVSALLIGSAMASCSQSSDQNVGKQQQLLQAEDWNSSGTYAVGDIVLYDGQTYRCILAHTAIASWTPPNSPSLWERYDVSSGEPESGIAGKLPEKPTLEDVVFRANCLEESSACCPLGATSRALTDGADTLQVLTPNECVLAANGSDTIFLQSTGPSALHLGGGDDTAFDGPGDDLILGGPGRDTINAYGGTNLLFGGAGDDTISAANGDNTVVPGPGTDTVSLGTGNDKVYIFDACEIGTGGDVIDGGTGHDILYVPLPLSELPSLVVSNFEEVIVAPMTCYSECAGGGSGVSSSGVLLDSTASYGNYRCPLVEDYRDGTFEVSCLAGEEEVDYASISPKGAGHRQFVFSYGGDDILVSDADGSFLLGGGGDDVVCAIAQGESGVQGGPGNDVLRIDGDIVNVIPDAGADQVDVVGGEARIYIHHSCEVEPGETYRLLGGAATIYSPLTRDELVGKGAVIDPAISVELIEPLPCHSSCGGAPVCAADEVCVDTDEGGFCIAKSPEFERTVPVEDRYSELPEELARELRQYVRSIETGEHRGVAPRGLRAKADLFEFALLNSINRDSERDREAEIFALGSLYTETALDALEDIALKKAPSGLEAGGHLDFGEQWYAGQFQAIRWIKTAGENLADREHYIKMLLNVIRDGDQYSRETAYEALLSLGPVDEMRYRVAHLLGADSPLLSLNFE